jgi:hypothetical protein
MEIADESVREVFGLKQSGARHPGIQKRGAINTRTAHPASAEALGLSSEDRPQTEEAREASGQPITGYLQSWCTSGIHRHNRNASITV